MKKLSVKKLITVLTVFVLSLGMFCFSGCNTEKQNEEVAKNDFSIYLTSSEAEVVETENEVYIEKTLKATVTAQDSNADTYINWTASWSNSEVAENVSDYLKILPTTLGSTTAKVRCYKNFEEFGEIVIKATARVDSTKYATCIATYIGAPESFDIKYGSVSISGTTVEVSLGSTYIYNLDLYNSIGLGSNYGTYEVSFLNISGTIDIKYEYWGTSGNTANATLSSVDVKNVCKITEVELTRADGTSFVEKGLDNSYLSNSSFYLKTTFTEEGNLSIVCSKVYNGLNGTENYGGATCPRAGLKVYTIGCDLVIQTKITEKTSNKSVIVNFKIGG